MTAPSIDELLKDIPPAHLARQCSDKYLADVSKQITNWRLLAPYMDISESERHSIQESCRSYEEQKQEMLFKWKQKCSEKATVHALLETIYSSRDIKLLQQHFNQTSEGTVATVPIISPTLINLQERLKFRYRNHKPVNVHEWPPPPSLDAGYIKLVLLPKKQVERGEIKNDDMYAKICGGIDNEIDTSKEVDLQQLLALNPADEHKVILFEGAPGSGKSTLFWHICQKWQSGELFRQFTLVFLVQLKDTGVHAAKCLVDLIPCMPSRSQQFRELQKSIESEIEAIHGKGVLIMLDGWDEVPTKLRQEGSIFHDLIAAPYKFSIDKAVVLVSSRPSASNDQWVYFSHRIELQRFTKQSQERYIRETLKNNPSGAQRLIEEVQSSDNITDFSLPLNIANLTHIFSTSEGKLPTTPCRVTIALVLSHLLRHIMKTHRSKIKMLQSLDNLPYPINKQFNHLCKIAYDATVKEIYSFTAEELTATSDTSQSPEQTEVATLSLLESVHSLVATGSLVQYHFLHLSFQELCAAYYISRLPDPEKTHIEALRKLRMSNFHAVCNFYSALTSLKTHNIAQHLEIYFSHYDDILEYMLSREETEEMETEEIDSSADKSSEVKWNDLFLRSYDEKYDAIVMNDRGYITLFFFKFLMESENPSVVDAMIGKKLRVNITTDTERTLTAVVKMASMLETVVYKVYDFSQQMFHALSNKQHLKTFVLFAYRYITDCTCFKGMLAALLTCPKLKDVFIRVRFSNSDVALKTASLISNTFQHMSLENINFIAQSTMQDEAVAALAPAFINTSCVRVDCCEVGCLALKRISDVSLLSSKFKFIEITLEQYGGEDRAFFSALKTARSLETVVLEGELSVSDSAVGRMLLSGDLEELAHLFGVTTSPIVTKTLHVHIFDSCIEIDFKNKCFISVGFVSCQHKYRCYGISKDEHIKVKIMMDSRGMHKLSTSLSIVPVKELNLTAHKIGDVGAKYLREPLGKNLYLEQLIIHNCGIEEDGIASLFAGLARNNMVTTLDASLNPFGDNGAVKLAEYINRTSLQVLDISTCNIGEHGMVAIATALRTNTTLRKLSLYSPEQVITQRSEVALAKALVHNRTLKYIQVNQNLLYHYSPFYMDNNLRTFNITLKATLALLEEYSSSELYNSVKMSSTVSSIAVDFASPLGRVLLSGDMSTAANILLLHQPPFGKGEISLHMLDNTWSVYYDGKCVTEQDKGLIYLRRIKCRHTD